MEWITNLRWWLARKIAPEVNVRVKHGGRQHIVRRVEIGPMVLVEVPFKITPTDENVDFGGRSLTPSDIQQIIGAGTAAEGSEYWPEEQLHTEGGGFGPLVDKDGNECEVRPVPQDVIDQLREDVCGGNAAEVDRGDEPRRDGGTLPGPGSARRPREEGGSGDRGEAADAGAAACGEGEAGDLRSAGDAPAREDHRG